MYKNVIKILLKCFMKLNYQVFKFETKNKEILGTLMTNAIKGF